MLFPRFFLHGKESEWKTVRSVCRNDPYNRLYGMSPSWSADWLLYDTCVLLCIYILTELCPHRPALPSLWHINFSYCLRQAGFSASSPLPDGQGSDCLLPYAYPEQESLHGNLHGSSLKLYLPLPLFHRLQGQQHLPRNAHDGQ